MINGAVIVESLRPGAVFDDSHLHVRRLSRMAVSDNTPEQPPVWTVVEFSSEAGPTELAERFADALTGRGWYVSYTADDEIFVIFPGKTFRYRAGDGPARREVEDYARQAGVPESQLDW